MRFIERSSLCVGGYTGLSGSSRHLRQTEIENLGVPALGNENVGGLDVAMNNAFAVGRVERVGNLDGQTEQKVGFEGFSGDPMLERQPVQKLHNDEWLAILLSDFINGADVGMVKGGCGLRLALEARQCLSILGDLVGQKLQGDEAAQSYILGLVDDTHPAAADLLHECGSAR